MFIGSRIDNITELYRLFVLVVSFFLLTYLLIRKRITYNIQLVFFAVFWILYSIRIIYDLLIIQVPIYSDNSRYFYLQYTFGVILIPTITTILLNKNYNLDYKKIYNVVFLLLFFTLLITVYKRMSNIEIIDRSSKILNIGIIEFGHYGCTLILLAIYGLIKNRLNILTVLFYLVAIILGFSAMIISASKGPLISLLVSLFLFLFLSFNFKKYIIIVFILLLILYFFGFYFIDVFSEFFDSNFLVRILQSIDSGGDEARDLLRSAAIEEFINNPIFGNSMFIQKSGLEGSYPHNLFVEAFMATGIIGGLFFVILIVLIFLKSFEVIKNNLPSSWIALIFFQYILFGMFSSNLYSLDLFWISMAIVLGTKSNIKINNKKI